MRPEGPCARGAVVLNGVATTWEELGRDLAGAAAPGQGLAVVARDLQTPWAALAASAVEGWHLVVVDAARADDALLARLRAVGFTVLDGDTRAAPTGLCAAGAGRVTVLTSGTTGAPKLVEHDLAALTTRLADPAQPVRRWLCPYAPGTYAWYQVAVTSLASAGQSVVPVLPRNVDGWVEVALRDGVTALSATPSFWRSTLLRRSDAELRALPMTQITLGGEVVDQPLLDQLAALFPTARLTHVYASTEAGAAFAVHDGLAGFPASWLQAPRSNGVRLRLRDDLLEVASPYAHRGAGAWVATGDRVAVIGDRVHVLGRADGAFLNVGGAKVDAAQVRAVLLEHPDVLWATVRGRRAPVLGQVPVADVVLRPGSSATSQDLRAHCARRLPEVAAPRLVTVHDDVPVSATLKERR